MATKKKKAEQPATPAPETPAAEPLAQLVDELGQIEKDLAPHAAKIARQKNLREAIRKQTPDSQIQVHGALFVAILGDRGNETLVDFPALAKRIGFEAFAQFATAPLKALYQHVKPGVLALFTRTEQTGPRSLKVLEKGRPAQP